MEHIQLDFVYPMYALVVHTFFVSLIMVKRRRESVRSKKTPMSYFKTYDQPVSDERMLTASRNFSNLFEVPVLFYAGCTLAVLLNDQGWMLLALAWIFVGLRVVHSWVHLTSNKVLWRMRTFMLGYFAILIFWTLLVFKIATQAP